MRDRSHRGLGKVAEKLLFNVTSNALHVSSCGSYHYDKTQSAMNMATQPASPDFAMNMKNVTRLCAMHTIVGIGPAPNYSEKYKSLIVPHFHPCHEHGHNLMTI